MMTLVYKQEKKLKFIISSVEIYKICFYGFFIKKKKKVFLFIIFIEPLTQLIIQFILFALWIFPSNCID